MSTASINSLWSHPREGPGHIHSSRHRI